MKKTITVLAFVAFAFAAFGQCEYAVIEMKPEAHLIKNKVLLPEGDKDKEELTAAIRKEYDHSILLNVMASKGWRFVQVATVAGTVSGDYLYLYFERCEKK